MGTNGSVQMFEDGELDKAFTEDITMDWGTFRQSYDLAIQSIIRPPREMYHTTALGPGNCFGETYFLTLLHPPLPRLHVPWRLLFRVFISFCFP